MELVTLFIILMAFAVIGFFSLFVIDEDAWEFVAVLSFVLLITGIIGFFVSAQMKSQTAIINCLESSAYKKGTQVRIKNIPAPVLVTDVKCTDYETNERLYEVATLEGAVIEVKEQDLEK
jgi:c-di-AMP phosphodiesterase-like protein